MRTTIPVSTLLLAGALLSTAQTTPDQTGSISGIVLDHAGQPIPAAMIQLIFIDGPSFPDIKDPADRLRTTLTDAKGRFALNGVPAGTHVFRVVHPQYLPLASGTETPGSPPHLKLNSGQNAEFTFTLSSGATVTGRVVDADGDPLSRVRVEVLQPVFYYGRRGLDAVAEGRTGDNGDFTITKVPPGKYYLRAVAAALAASTNAQERTPVPIIKPGEKDIRSFCVFYGGTTQPQQALAITVADGQEFSAGEMTMLSKPFIHVRGKVIGDPGVLAGARVVRLASEINTSVAFTDGADIQPDGSFDKANLWTGDFTLAVYKRPAGALGWVNITTTDEDMANVVINASVAPLSGAVHVDSDDPATPIPSPFGLSLTAADGLRGGQTLALVTPENTFAIPLLAPGRYIADAPRIPAGWYIKSMQLDGRDVLDSGFTFSGGAKLDVVISPKAASIEGVIVDKDGNPLQGKVTLVPDTPNFGHARLYPSAGAGADGSFKLPSVTPGRYHIYAWEDILDTAHWNTTYTQPFRSSSQAVEVKEGEHARLTLQRISAATMEQTLSRYGY